MPGLPRRRTRPPVGASSGCNLPRGVHGHDAATVSQYEAVRLFIERAGPCGPTSRSPTRTRPAVAEIRARLDGLPLAIELAAARIKLLTPEAILARLEHRLRCSAGGRDLPERQQTLRGAIAWSYDLLDAGEPAAVRAAVGVRGGWTRGGGGGHAARRRSGHRRPRRAGVARRQEPRPRRRERHGEPRFLMLETIREYAGRKARGARRARTRSCARHAMVSTSRSTRRRSCPARPAALARPARARARQPACGPRLGDDAQPDRRRGPARVRAVAVLAAARLPRRGTAPARGDGRREQWTRRPRLRGPLRSRRRRRRLLAGRPAACASLVPGGARDLARASATRARSPTRCTTLLYAARTGRARSATGDRTARARREARRGPRAFREIGDKAGEAQHPVGPRRPPLLPRRRTVARRRVPGGARTASARPGTGRWRHGRSTCWAWCRSAAATRARRGPRRPHAPSSTRPATSRAHPHPRRPGVDRASPTATSSGRAGCAAPRASSAARPGTTLADFVGEHLQAVRRRPHGPRDAAEDVERLAAEGAAMGLDEVVAYALERRAAPMPRRRDPRRRDAGRRRS